MEKLSKVFSRYYKKRIAVYGLGTETEKVLPELAQEFQIIGLLDGYREEGELYNIPIISMNEVIAQQVELIIVVARPGSCKAIAKRIGKICVENQIALMDIRGKDLCEERKVIYDFKSVDGLTKNELHYLMCQHDVISVDLFDTLVMRNTLFYTDVYEIVDMRLKKLGIKIDDFAGKRLESEKFLAKTTAPTLEEIYQYMIDRYKLTDISAEKLANVEWKTDCDLLVPRKEMCELITEVYRQGKEVYIVSDTYYTKKQLVGLIEEFDILSYTEIIASCEYKTSKTQQLYAKLQEKCAGKSCIHIGDDEVADIECASKFGLRTCKIHSGMELLEAVGYFGMWDAIETLSDRIKIGMFVARLFNSPFQFETDERKICVDDIESIGYLFLAPMITDFVLWFDNKVQENQISNIWLSARDGYLLKQLYEYLRKDNFATYFLTSRIVAIRAGMETDKDIRYVTDMKFSGTLQKQLAERFGITKNDAEMSGASSENLMDYKDEIFEKAFEVRRNYKKYISGLNLTDGDIAFFDFVAKGTSQLYIARLVPNHLKGLYFLQLEEEHMREYNLDIIPFYTSEEKSSSVIFDDYYILETILTAPTPSVKEFDVDGTPIYATETRSEEDIACILKVQSGVIDYFKTYLSIGSNLNKAENKKLDEKFLGLIHKILISKLGFLNLKVEDPFFNRTTDVVDLL